MNSAKPFGKWFKISTPAGSWGNEFHKFITCCITWCFFKNFCLNHPSYRKGGKGRVPAANQELMHILTETSQLVLNSADFIPLLSVGASPGWRGWFFWLTGNNPWSEDSSDLSKLGWNVTSSRKPILNSKHQNQSLLSLSSQSSWAI